VINAENIWKTWKAELIRVEDDASRNGGGSGTGQLKVSFSFPSARRLLQNWNGRR
jgi:hypothetical protein